MYSLRFLWGAFAKKGRTEPSKRVAAMHAPPVTFLAAPAILAAAGLLFGLWPSALDNALDTYADTVPGRRRLRARALARLQPAAAAVGARAGDRHRRVLRPVTVAAHEAGVSAAGQRGPHLRRGDPRRRRALRPADRHHAARLDSRNAVGDPGDAGIVPVVVLALGARDRPEFALWGSPLQVIVGAADTGRRGRRDRDAQPSRGGAARRRDRLRLRHHLRVPRRTRPGPDPVPGGDPDAGHLRAGAADAARRVRPHQHPQAPAAAGGAGAGRRRERDHTGGVRDGSPHRCPDRRAAARRRVLPRKRRQHRQRAAGRHPGLGHPRRDLGAVGRCDRCGVNGVPAQTVRRRAAGRRRRPARHRASATRSRRARPPATPPGCAAASCATRGTGRWCSRSRPG